MSTVRRDGLVRLQREGLELAFERWQQLREAHATAAKALAEEKKKLEEQGGFLLGTVKAAASVPVAGGESQALVKPEPALEQYLKEAQGKLDAARAQQAERAQKLSADHTDAVQKVHADLISRIERSLANAKPKVVLTLRTLPGDRRILHGQRLKGEEPVTLAWALTKKLVSRFDFLFDDSTDDPALAPPSLYAEEGISQVRPGPADLKALLASNEKVLPLKGMLLIPVGAELFRFVQRGVVMEAELADGDGFRNVLSREESERLSGYLLRLHLAGEIEVEITAGS